MNLIKIFCDEKYEYFYCHRNNLTKSINYYRGERTSGNKVYHITMINSLEFALAVKNHFEKSLSEED